MLPVSASAPSSYDARLWRLDSCRAFFYLPRLAFWPGGAFVVLRARAEAQLRVGLALGRRRLLLGGLLLLSQCCLALLDLLLHAAHAVLIVGELLPAECRAEPVSGADVVIEADVVEDVVEPSAEIHASDHEAEPDDEDAAPHHVDACSIRLDRVPHVR